MPSALCELDPRAAPQAVWDQMPHGRAGAAGHLVPGILGPGWQAGLGWEGNFVLVRVQDKPSSDPEKLSKVEVLLETALSLFLKKIPGP